MPSKYFLVLALLILFGCQNSSSSNEQASEETPPPPTFKLDLLCTDISEEETMPKNQISLQVNRVLYVLDTIASCELIEASDYENYDIPSDALVAKGGWFAGAGDYFYVSLQGESCKVMKGWQDEMQEDDGFHYEEIKSIDLAKH